MSQGAHSGQSTTLLLAKPGDIARIEYELNRFGAFGWQNVVAIRALANEKLPHQAAIIRQQRNNANLLYEHGDNGFDKIVAFAGLPLDIQQLRDDGIDCREVYSVKTMIEAARDKLKACSLDWLGYANLEWQKSDIRGITPKLWSEQFSLLGYPTVGQHLLKNLRVLPRADLTKAFTHPQGHDIGLHIAHGYIKDNEPGSSSEAIKDALYKMYLTEDVIAIDLQALESLSNTKADLIYVYEDGLWSGVELIKRLNKIWQSVHFRNSNLQLHFKYATTSDAGLAAARLFARREGSARFQFFAANNHFSFFDEKNDPGFRTLRNQSDPEIRRAIDAAIEPYAFRTRAMWGEEREDAMAVCADIGAQLVKPYLARKNTNVTDEDIKQWQLGAGGFASTIVFASSIPKPALPLLWLHGKVSVNGKTIDWRPLFWDTRRTGMSNSNQT